MVDHIFVRVNGFFKIPNSIAVAKTAFWYFPKTNLHHGSKRKPLLFSRSLRQMKNYFNNTCFTAEFRNELLRNFYRQDDEKRQTAGIKFTHRPKIRFFAPQGRLVAPIHVKLGRTDAHVGPLGCAKCHLNRHRGWESGRKISKISTFW